MGPRRVASFAIALLSKLGYRVVASTGRGSEHEYLSNWARLKSSTARLCEPGKPWPRALGSGNDSVGSHTLANACASTRAKDAPRAVWPRGWISLPRWRRFFARRHPGRHQQRDSAKGAPWRHGLDWHRIWTSPYCH